MTKQLDVEIYTILTAAIRKWGPKHQEDKCLEEMSELAKEILKNRDGKSNKNKIAEEAADLYITLLQIIMIHDIDILFDDYLFTKMISLGERIEKEHFKDDN